MYNQNNANNSLVSKCDTTGRPEHANGLTWISLAHLRSFTSLQMQLKYNAASFFRASRLHHISRHRLRLIEMENAWSNSSNSSQNSFQYFMFCMHVWQFSSKAWLPRLCYWLRSGEGKGETGEGTVEGTKSVGKEFLETLLIERCPRWHEKLRRRPTANQERTDGKPSCLYSVWKTNWNLESIKVLLKSALLVCTRFICAKTETPVSFSYFFSLGTRRNDNLLPEVLTPGGILQISSDRRSLTRTRWQGWSEDFFCVGKFYFWG